MTGSSRLNASVSIQSRYYAFGDACVKWTECVFGSTGFTGVLFHGAHESSEAWLHALEGRKAESGFADLHLLDFPGFGDSWTCGGREWTVPEWAALIRAAIDRVAESADAGSLILVAHGLSTLPLSMALLGGRRWTPKIGFVALLNPVSWLKRPGRSEVSRVVADSWPGPLEVREWIRGLAELRTPVLIVQTEPRMRALQVAEEFLVPFPRGEVWFKEGAALDEVLGRMREFSQKLKRPDPARDPAP